MIRALALGVGLALLWLGLSGHYTPLILSFGAASIVLIVYLSIRLDILDSEGMPLQLGTGFVLYWVWLGVEIVKSNLHIARIILSPNMPINPQIIRFPSTQKTDLGQVIYANSITLTPGTTTIEIEEGQILIHALTDKTANLEGGAEMDKRVTQIERAQEAS